LPNGKQIESLGPRTTFRADYEGESAKNVQNQNDFRSFPEMGFVDGCYNANADVTQDLGVVFEKLDLVSKLLRNTANGLPGVVSDDP
jgi:hypothetical protein